jgi:hypothetical protein
LNVAGVVVVVTETAAEDDAGGAELVGKQVVPLAFWKHMCDGVGAADGGG